MTHLWSTLSVGVVAAVSGGLPVLAPDAGEVTRDLRPGETTIVLEVDMPPDIDAQWWDGLHIEAGDAGDVAVAVRADWAPWVGLWVNEAWDRRWVDPYTSFHAGVLHADGTFDVVLPGGGGTATFDGEHHDLESVYGAASGADGTVDLISSTGVHRVDGDTATTMIPGVAIRPITDLEPGEPTIGLSQPTDLARDVDGRTYLTLSGADRGTVRRIEPDGTVTRLTGGGTGNEVLPPDGALAADVALVDPYAVDVDPQGNVYILHGRSWRGIDLWPAVLKITPDGTIARVAGSPEPGFSGDGGPATEAVLSHSIADIAVDAEGTLYIADAGNQAIRAVSPDGTITTVGPAMSPSSITVTTGGDLYAAVGNQVVRADLREPGIGFCTGEPSEATDDPWAGESPGTVVTLAEGSIAAPVSLAVRPDGGVFVIDAENGGLHAVGDDGEVAAAVDDVSPLGDRVTAVAHGTDGVYYAAVDGSVVEVHPDGTRIVMGGGASSPDPFAPTTVRSVPLGVTDLECGADGSLYGATADSVFRIAPDGGLETVEDTSGTWSRDHNGLGLGPDGQLLWAAPRTLRAVGPPGGERVIAGVEDGPAGDDGRRAAGSVLPLGTSADVVADADGTVYVSSHDRVRTIDADGLLGTVLEYDEDGVEGARAAGLAFDAHGNLYVADPGGGAVRVIVRPGEVGPTLWPWIAAAAVVAALAVGGFLARDRLRLLVSRFGERGSRRPPPPPR